MTLKTELLPLIASLGDVDIARGEVLPGTAPIFKTEGELSGEKFARGTTWDFGGVTFDGEEMRRMSEAEKPKDLDEGDDDNDDIFEAMNAIGENRGET